MPKNPPSPYQLVALDRLADTEEAAPEGIAFAALAPNPATTRSLIINGWALMDEEIPYRLTLTPLGRKARGMVSAGIRTIADGIASQA